MGVRTVDLVEYSAAWAVDFEHEAAALRDVLGTTALAIEHIGSTSVPGLVAKPTIDIALGVTSIAELDSHRDALESLGYDRRGGFHDAHVMWRKIVGDERTHHLHAIVHPHPDFEEWVLLRDYMRASPDAAQAYADEKRRLAELYYHQRSSYAEGKTEVVTRLLAEARARP